MGLLPYLNDPPVFLLAFLLGAFGLILHNLFQAWLADRYGEVAPRRYGFLRLDPRVHLEPLGLVLLALLGFGSPLFVAGRTLVRVAAWMALLCLLRFVAAVGDPRLDRVEAGG